MLKRIMIIVNMVAKYPEMLVSYSKLKNILRLGSINIVKTIFILESG